MSSFSSKMEDIPGPWREYEEPERATSKPLIPTMITNDELDKLRRKYLRMRAEISGLSLKEESNQQRVIHFHMTFLTESRTFSIKATRVILQVGLSEDVDGDGEGDYLDVIDKV